MSEVPTGFVPRPRPLDPTSFEPRPPDPDPTVHLVIIDLARRQENPFEDADADPLRRAYEDALELTIRLRRALHQRRS